MRGGYKLVEAPKDRRSESYSGIAEHTLVAERSLGKRLPAGAQVHHVDEDRKNNKPANLVVCQDQTYHKLLHRRMVALRECGHADWRRCGICKQWSPPDDLWIGKEWCAHRSCNAKRARENGRAKGAPPRIFRNGRPTL
jgi:hypothetical protein